MKYESVYGKCIAVLLLFGGFGLMSEHLIHNGYYDPTVICHGFYGLVMIIAGWIVGMLNRKYVKNENK